MTGAGTPVTRALEELGLPYQLHRHDQPVRSLEQAAADRGLDPEQIVRTLLFRLETGAYFLLLMPGPEQVDWGKLRRYLGVSRVTTASAEEVREVTGFEPGAVAPFGLRQPLRLLGDLRLRELDRISLGAGERDAGVVLQVEDLLEALAVELADFRPDDS